MNNSKSRTQSLDSPSVDARPSPWMRAVTLVTLIAFLNSTVAPAFAATPVQAEPEVLAAAPPASVPSPKRGQELGQLRELLRGYSTSPRVANTERRAALRKLREQIVAANARDLADFDAIESKLRESGASEEILGRHREAVDRFKRESSQVTQELESVGNPESDEAAFTSRVQALDERLRNIRTERRHQKFDPANLPMGIPKSQRRAPRQTDGELREPFLHAPERAWYAGFAAPIFAGAQFTPGPLIPGAEHLAETTDVRITPEIRELAASLNNSPVEIFNWVHNNIVFDPTFGGIQGSADTLASRHGNAFDTASLLIALLRAAGVPARYAYGTVEIPIAQVMNWTGGMTDPNAALDFMAQGGVPVLGLAQSGVIKAARLEHVWVEALVKFNPGRGARPGVPDGWVPMDASFKQYEAIPALITAEQTDALRAAAQAYVDSPTPAAGGVTSFDTSIFDTQLAAVQEQVSEVFASNTEKFSIEEFIGGRKIIEVTRPVLGGSLPYKVVARGPNWAALPDSMRLVARVELLDANLAGDEGNVLMSSVVPIATLGYGSLQLTHVAASSADAAVWDSYIDAQQFPAYLVRVRSRLTLNGNTLAETGAMELGRDLALRVTFVGPTGGGQKVARFAITSGDEVQIGVNAAGVEPLQGMPLLHRADLDNAEGNLFVIGKTFWTQADFQQRVLGQLGGIATSRLPSVGIFASPIKVEYSFGVPRRASYGAYLVDVKLAQMSAKALDGSTSKTVTHVLHTGLVLSTLEGAAVEQVLRKEIGHGANTTRMLELANASGMPILQISSENIASLRGQLQHSSAVRADVEAAVAAGLQVVIPQASQDYKAFSGTGYIMLDPETGSADYRISGGASGNIDEDACGRKTRPVYVTVPDVSFILWMLFGYLIDEDYNFNGVGVAVAIAQLVLVATICVVLAPTIGAAGAAAAAAGARAARAAAPLTRRALQGLLAAFAPVAMAGTEPDACSCEPEPQKGRKGGNSFWTQRHNRCANEARHTDYYGVDVKLQDINFDGWKVAEGLMIEIKTGMFYGFIAAAAQTKPRLRPFRDILLGKSIYDFYRERVPSGQCGFEFRFRLSDQYMIDDLKDFFINDANNPFDAARVEHNGC